MANEDVKIDEKGIEDQTVKEPEEPTTVPIKRFNKVWHDKSEAVRKLEKTEQDMALMREHLKKVTENMHQVQGEVLDSKMPDENADAKEVAEWSTKKAKHELSKPDEVPKKADQGTNEQERLNNLEQVVMDTFEDYREVAEDFKKLPEREIRALYMEAAEASNPFLTIYKAMKTRSTEKETKRKEAIEDQTVEGAGFSKGSKVKTLTSDQKKTAALFGMTEKDYKASLNINSFGE